MGSRKWAQSGPHTCGLPPSWGPLGTSSLDAAGLGEKQKRSRWGLGPGNITLPISQMAKLRPKGQKVVPRGKAVLWRVAGLC